MRLPGQSRWACALLLSAHALVAAVPADEWRLTRSAHFDIYSQSAEAPARAMAAWLEQLESLIRRQTGLDSSKRPPVRVIAFHSSAEYDPYRLAPTSDAYYVGSESRDYIMMAGVGSAQFGVAAHEYAHAVLKTAGAGLPLWLREGLAEVLASVKVTPRGATIGGNLVDRLDTLRRERWIGIPDLLALENESGLGGGVSVFYAESWALADLVLLAPAYSPRFPQFAAALAGGADSASAFERVYGKSARAIQVDLERRNARHGRVPMPIGEAAPAGVAFDSAPISRERARLQIAEVVMLTGDLARAAAMYGELQQVRPADPDIALGMGTVALRQGHPEEAREQWKRAIANGAADPILCYRYATLANLAGVPADEIRPVLQRAIELKPDYDDARFVLALLEGNAGNHESAVAQLRAMRRVSPGRAFGYWTALADSLTQVGQRSEARAAALKALDFASSEDERGHAAGLAHVAETDLAVRMTRDVQGIPRMITTRIPHGTAEFNPFIEPGDAMERIEGVLRDVDCGTPVLRIAVETPLGLVRLAIRGLDHVQIRNGTGEFTCGPQSGGRVAVEYAKSKAPADGVAGDVRGLEFR